MTNRVGHLARCGSLILSLAAAALAGCGGSGGRTTGAGGSTGFGGTGGSGGTGGTGGSALCAAGSATGTLSLRITGTPRATGLVMLGSGAPLTTSSDVTL